MKFMASFLAITACLAGASAASAGTSAATGAATLNIVNQCTVTGANVSLGTFLTTDTVQAVANQNGYQDSTTYDFVPGTNGIGTVHIAATEELPFTMGEVYRNFSAGKPRMRTTSSGVSTTGKRRDGRGLPIS